MVNSVILMGRLTRDPKTRTTGEGKSVSDFSIACTGYDGNSTIFVDCVAFNKKAEFVEKYFQKGQKVVVQGRLDVGKYKHVDPSGSGVTTTRYFTRIIINDVDFAEAKTNVAQESKPTEGLMEIPDGEELPFK